MAGKWGNPKPPAETQLQDEATTIKNRVAENEFQGRWAPHRMRHYSPGPGDEAMNKHLNAKPLYAFPDEGAPARAVLAAEAHKRAVAAGVTGDSDARIEEESKHNALMNPRLAWGAHSDEGGGAINRLKGREMGAARSKAGKLAHLISDHFLNPDQDAAGAMGVAAARMGAPVSGSASQINDVHAAHHPEGLDVGHTHGTRAGWQGRSSGWGRPSPTSATVNSVGSSRQVSNHPANAERNAELDRRSRVAQPTEQSIVDARGRIGY